MSKTQNAAKVNDERMTLDEALKACTFYPCSVEYREYDGEIVSHATIA